MKPARKDQLKSLLKDTVILMCKSVNFEQDLRVEGLVGVTIDNKEVILIGFNELLCGEEDCKGTNQLDVTRSSTSSINEVNRKPRKSETSSNQSTPKIERKSNTPQSHLQIKVKNEPSEKQDETSDMIICKDSETKKPENATGHDDDLIYVGKEYYSLVTGVKQELPSTSAELIVSSVRKRPKIDQLYSAVCRKRPNVQINCDDGTHAVPVAAGSSGRQGCRAVRRRPVCKQKFVNKTTKSTNRVPSISTESVKPQTKAENSQGKKQQADRSHVASTTVMLSESKPDQFSGIQGYTKTVTCPNLEEEEPHKEHRPKHSKQSNRSSVTCYLCGLGLSSTKALKWHMKKIHDITKPFSCSHCSKSFAWQQSFLRHMEKHDNGKDK